MPEAPLTCLDLWFRAGSSNERLGEEGMAHFLEHMVFKGSNNSKAGSFDREIEELGGSSNAATGFDDVHFHVLVPPKVVPQALELLLDLVLKPALRADEYEMEREVVLEEIAQHEDQPDEQVFQNLLETCWKDHTYGKPILGLRESLKASKPSQMKEFHKRLYTGRNCCLAIAGVIPVDIKSLIEEGLLARIPEVQKGGSCSNKSQVPTFKNLRKEIEIPRLESARFLMAWPIPAAKEQLLIMGADIATSIFSEGRRSRLVQKLREELQIVESIDMDITVLENGGLVLLEACCPENNLEVVEKEIHKTLIESLAIPIEKQEIERASRLISNGLYFSLEVSSQVAGLAGSQTLWGRKQPLLDILNHINYWTESQLQNKIFSLLQPEKSCTLIAKPKK